MLQENTQASLFVGGTRSGKSALALQYAAKQYAHAPQGQSQKPIFVATAKAYDQEMQKRISAHQQERKEQEIPWHCVESPLLSVQELESIQQEASVILVDCLSLWLNNIMEYMDDAEILTQTKILHTWVSQCPVPLVMVTNEVGQGMVPMHALARRYSDAHGLLNQYMARSCAHVFLVSCGLPLALKGKGLLI